MPKIILCLSEKLFKNKFLNFLRSSKYMLERIPSGKINNVSFCGLGSDILINSEMNSSGFSF